jgi:hypothetical protein
VHSCMGMLVQSISSTHTIGSCGGTGGREEGMESMCVAACRCGLARQAVCDKEAPLALLHSCTHPTASYFLELSMASPYRNYGFHSPGVDHAHLSGKNACSA